MFLSWQYAPSTIIPACLVVVEISNGAKFLIDKEVSSFHLVRVRGPLQFKKFMFSLSKEKYIKGKKLKYKAKGPQSLYY